MKANRCWNLELKMVNSPVNWLKKPVKLSPLTSSKARFRRMKLLMGTTRSLKFMCADLKITDVSIDLIREKIKEIGKHMEQVRLSRWPSELVEVKKRRVAASEVAEQKREAIRHLCVCLMTVTENV